MGSTHSVDGSSIGALSICGILIAALVALTSGLIMNDPPSFEGRLLVCTLGLGSTIGSAANKAGRAILVRAGTAGGVTNFGVLDLATVATVAIVGADAFVQVQGDFAQVDDDFSHKHRDDATTCDSETYV